MVEESKLLYVVINQHMYDLMIQKYGLNGGFDPTKVILKIIPLIKNG